MILLIDNYDSFVHNLARYVRELGRKTTVVRNDAISCESVLSTPPEAIIISPGPGRPNDAGISMDIVRRCGSIIPILGVCLGHQCIGEVFGGKTVHAPYPMHGQTSDIKHNGKELFMGLPSPFKAARYHSLATQLPENCELSISGSTDDIIMAFQHKTYPIYGIQFHPESCLTEMGHDIMRNFLIYADQWKAINAQKAA